MDIADEHPMLVESATIRQLVAVSKDILSIFNL